MTIEHRWPELADVLIAEPKIVDEILVKESQLPVENREIKKLLEKENMLVRKLLHGANQGSVLSSKVVKELLGLAEETTA